MGRRYNEEAFTPEEVKNGKPLKLLKTLFELQKDAVGEESNADKAFDIRIWTDGYCLIIDWCDRWFDPNIDSGHFEFIDEDQVVMKEVAFPDNSFEYVFDDEEAKARLDEWLKEHPKWHKNQFGMWTDGEGYSPMYDEIKDRYTMTSASTSDEPITIEPLKWEGDPVIYNED